MPDLDSRISVNKDQRKKQQPLSAIFLSGAGIIRAGCGGNFPTPSRTASPRANYRQHRQHSQCLFVFIFVVGMSAYPIDSLFPKEIATRNYNLRPIGPGPWQSFFCLQNCTAMKQFFHNPGAGRPSGCVKRFHHSGGRSAPGGYRLPDPRGTGGISHNPQRSDLQ